MKYWLAVSAILAGPVAAEAPKVSYDTLHYSCADVDSDATFDLAAVYVSVDDTVFAILTQEDLKPVGLVLDQDYVKGPDEEPHAHYVSLQDPKLGTLIWKVREDAAAIESIPPGGKEVTYWGECTVTH